MNTGPQVTFTSDFFKPIPGEDEHTNPGCYGKAWATWLAERCGSEGFQSKASSRKILAGW